MGGSVFTVCLQIENIELPLDPKSKKRRGFIFITYKEEASAKKCLEKKYHTVEGSMVPAPLRASFARFPG